jgi:hypothetical protein
MNRIIVPLLIGISYSILLFCVSLSGCRCSVGLSVLMRNELVTCTHFDSYAHSFMPKSNRSSASSATRKKHARKADPQAAAAGPAIVNPSKKKKSKLQEPHVKSYTPPVKPQAARPDPVDGLGVDGDLYVMLRALGKKSVATKVKAMADLARWLELPEADVKLILPVWVRCTLRWNSN